MEKETEISESEKMYLRNKYKSEGVSRHGAVKRMRKLIKYF